MARGALVKLGVLAITLWPARGAHAICREVHLIDSSPPMVDPDQSVAIIVRPADPSCVGQSVDGGVDGDGGASCETRDIVSMIVQPKFASGPAGARFAFLMVTPTPPVLRLESPATFIELARATLPRDELRRVTVEDERLGYQCDDPVSGCGGGGESSGGCGAGGDSTWNPPDIRLADSGAADAGDGGAVVQTLGNYDYAILAITDDAELTAWLDAQGFAHTRADIDAVSPYLRQGFSLVAVRVGVDRAVSGLLTPLSLTYQGTTPVLPFGLLRQSTPGEAFITAYVSAPHRWDFPGAHIAYADWNPPYTGRFLTRSDFMVRLDVAAADPVAVQRADTPHRDVHVIIEETRIPSSKCPGGGKDDDAGCCCRLRPRDRTLPGTLTLGSFLIAFVLVLRRRRR